jgi:CubicO group peptidase (beta-lactamase class C family)
MRLGCLASLIFSVSAGIGSATGAVAQSAPPVDQQKETFAGRSPHPLNAQRVAAMKAFVAKAMKDLGVPGVGFALIDHGKIVFEGGLGVRNLDKPKPVDAHTLFMIGSNTKGMSTLMLARLVDEGKLDWDESVVKAYPSFRLGDPELTEKVLIRHLVCACTGLPRKDLIWILGTKPDTRPSGIFEQLASSKPTAGLGETFQYSNLMAAAGGYVGGAVAEPGKDLCVAYDTAMQSLVFDPVGMAETTFDMAWAQSGNFASPHDTDLDDVVRRASIATEYQLVPYRPAGGAWSSAHDMIKYVALELTEGVITDTKYGVTVIHHGGGTSGFISDIVILPDAQVGAVILTNAEVFQFRSLFMQRLLKLVYDGGSKADDDLNKAIQDLATQRAKMRAGLTLPASPEATAKLANDYLNDELGHIHVDRDGSKVTFRFPLWSTEMSVRTNPDGTVAFVTIDPGVAGLKFTPSTSDGKPAFRIHERQIEYLYVAN